MVLINPTYMFINITIMKIYSGNKQYICVFNKCLCFRSSENTNHLWSAVCFYNASPTEEIRNTNFQGNVTNINLTHLSVPRNILVHLNATETIVTSIRKRTKSTKNKQNVCSCNTVFASAILNIGTPLPLFIIDYIKSSSDYQRGLKIGTSRKF